MAYLIGLYWTGTPTENTAVAGLCLLFALILVVLYSRARQGQRDTADLTQGDVINIPTWKRSYGLDVQKPYRRQPYVFEDV